MNTRILPLLAALSGVVYGCNKPSEKQGSPIPAWLPLLAIRFLWLQTLFSLVRLLLRPSQFCLSNDGLWNQFALFAYRNAGTIPCISGSFLIPQAQFGRARFTRVVRLALTRFRGVPSLQTDRFFSLIWELKSGRIIGCWRAVDSKA